MNKIAITASTKKEKKSKDNKEHKDKFFMSLQKHIYAKVERS